MIVEVGRVALTENEQRDTPSRTVVTDTYQAVVEIDRFSRRTGSNGRNCDSAPRWRDGARRGAYSRSAGGDANERVRDAMSWSTKLNGWVLDLKSEDQRDYGSINKNTNDCGTMVNLGGESKQELFDGGLVWCDERAMWARTTRTARLGRLHTCEVTNNGRDDGTNLAVRESTVNEKIWARNIKRIGVYTNVEYDAEMNLLLSTASRHAVELVKQQYDFVLLSTTEYRHYPMGPYVMMQYSA
ncbi:hypothetical protein PI125_g21187 [Phytophthora idaei]|nr:hypothetical protein PI125_g21187 [Phytophthora idaei]